jgi:IS30 family transposase
LSLAEREEILRTLFIQACGGGALKKELLQHLRRTRRMRRSRHHTQKTADHGRITDAVSIRERPAEAEDRAVPGHWEGDLLFGSKNSQIATLVERHSRYVLLARVKSKDSETVINALIKQAHKLPRELYKSLTWDRDSEVADHNASPWTRISKFTSVIHTVPGSEAPTKTPMACSGSTSPRAWICQTFIRTG